MTHPATKLEYLRRFAVNQRVEGYGIGNIYCHFPCPFCAAADFVIYELLQVEKALESGATCKECGRSAKAIFERHEGSVGFEIVQTGGADQPEWLIPKMRRIDN